MATYYSSKNVLNVRKISSLFHSQVQTLWYNQYCHLVKIYWILKNNLYIPIKIRGVMAKNAKIPLPFSNTCEEKLNAGIQCPWSPTKIVKFMAIRSGVRALGLDQYDRKVKMFKISYTFVKTLMHGYDVHGAPGLNCENHGLWNRCSLFNLQAQTLRYNHYCAIQ